MSSKKHEGKVLSFPKQPSSDGNPVLQNRQSLSSDDIQWGFPFDVPCLGSGSPGAEEQCRFIHRIAPTHATVNLSGPKGSGRSAIAFLMHEQSPNNSKSFWEIDFSDAETAFLQIADPIKMDDWIQSFAGGTLYLSHFDHCGLESQTLLLNLLRHLESRRVIQQHGKTRILIGSESSLDTLYAEDQIKPELFHLLSVVELVLAPLHGRIADILSIAENFLTRESASNEAHELGFSFSDAALEALLTYHWPHNAMELLQTLKTTVNRLKIDGRSLIEAKDIRPLLSQSAPSQGQPEKLKDAVRRFERAQIQRAIAEHQGSKEEAAEALGLSLASLYRKLA